MTRGVVAGEIIVDRLRDRIVSGVFLGNFKPGERLPSVREIAHLESVDRKTAAAAYRRLQREGLVRVRARSGVYLRERALADPANPLQRLHRRWLEKTYEGARSLGIDTSTIAQLVGSVIETERMRIPVIEADWSQARAIAGELRRRLTIRAVPYLLSEIDPADPVVAAAPFLITTPYQSLGLRAVVSDKPVLQVVLSRAFLAALDASIADGAVIIVPSEQLARRVRGSLRRHVDGTPAKVKVIEPRDRQRLPEKSADAAKAFLWLGTPRWFAAELRDTACVTVDRAVAETSIARIRQAVLDHAIRNVGQARGAPARPAAARRPPRGRRAACTPIRGPEAA
jgi:DNA-binding transcriptional regulator YhcF (GntR family)